MTLTPERMVLAGTVVVSAALAWFSIWPNWAEASDKARHADVLAEKVGSLDEAQRALEAATARLSDARSLKDSICLDVPASADVAGLMQRLALDIDGRHVRDQTFTVVDGPANETDRFKALPLRVEMESSFASVWEVLERIERLGRLVRVSGLDVVLANPDEPSDVDPTLQASLSLDVIYAPGGESTP